MNNSESNDDKLKIDAGEEVEKLETGEDLALAALSKSKSGNSDSSKPGGTNSNSDDSDFDTDDEVRESNELAETLTALQNLIERNANELERVKSHLKEKRESYRSVFENDATLQEAVDEAETVKQQVKERKSIINNSPQATSLKTQMSDLNQEKKEIEEALSNHLINYYSLTNSKSFDTSSGDQWEFDIKAKVKGKPKNA
jgi:DNA repair exonuclease SbcCD ATPase subunit